MYKLTTSNANAFASTFLSSCIAKQLQITTGFASDSLSVLRLAEAKPMPSVRRLRAGKIPALTAQMSFGHFGKLQRCYTLIGRLKKNISGD